MIGVCSFVLVIKAPQLAMHIKMLNIHIQNAYSIYSRDLSVILILRFQSM